MSKFEFKLPDIGEGVTEGEIVSWLVAVGDDVTEDQEMVEVMTDKATVTIPSPKSGKIAELKGEEGDVIPVGETLVVFDLAGGGEAKDESQDEGQKSEAKGEGQKGEGQKGEGQKGEGQKGEGQKGEPKKESAATAVGDIKEDLPGTGGDTSGDGGGSGPALAAPATRKLARELGVDLNQVKGTGSSGRITREDVEAAAGQGSGQSSSSPAPSQAAPPAIPAGPAPRSAPGDQRVPLRGLRKRIAENMARSKRTAAHFAYADEVECSKLIDVRNRTKAYAEQEGVKLTYLPFIVKACVAALKKHPMLNTLMDDANNEMIHKSTYDIGIATATEQGLIVPVIRDADRRSILDIAREIARLAGDARAGKIAQSDVGGSSFTVTSLGRQGGLFSTPVVNYPEVAIMGVHEMKKRPIVVDDEIRIGHVMVLALSFDHRIIDGHVGAAFAQEVKALLEDPDRLLVEMA